VSASSRMADHVLNGVVSARRSLSMSSSYRSGAAPLMSCAFEEFKGGSHMKTTGIVTVSALTIGAGE
jgi:hypothetical protein